MSSFLCCNDLKFRDLTGGKDVCKRYILGKLDFRFSLSPPVTSSPLPLAAVNYLKKFINICNMCYFHFQNLLS